MMNIAKVQRVIAVRFFLSQFAKNPGQECLRAYVSVPFGDPDYGLGLGEQVVLVSRFEELGAKLSDLEEIRTTAVGKLEAIHNCQERIAQMEKDRDALLESYVLRAPEALDGLTSKERYHVYSMLRL